jgi:hypothetical protein
MTRKKWRLLDIVEGICAVCGKKTCNCPGCIESRGVSDRCSDHRGSILQQEEKP